MYTSRTTPERVSELPSSDAGWDDLEREQEALTERLEQIAGLWLTRQGAGQFVGFEPGQVLRVARGEPARWVRGGDGRWFVVTRVDQVVGGEIIVTRRDGTSSVEVIKRVIADGQVDGVQVAVVEV